MITSRTVFLQVELSTNVPLHLLRKKPSWAFNGGDNPNRELEIKQIQINVAKKVAKPKKGGKAAKRARARRAA